MLRVAAATQTKGLIFLARLIAASWVLNIGVWAVSARTGADLQFFYTTIDGVVIAALARGAVSTSFPGRWLYRSIISFLTLQMAYRYRFQILGSDADQFWLDYLGEFMNFVFAIMLLLIIGYGKALLQRRNRPERFQDSMIGRMANWKAPTSSGDKKAGPSAGESRTAANPIFANAEPEGPIERLIYNLMADVADTDRLPEDHVKRPKSASYEDMRKKGAVPAKPRD